MEFRNMFSSIFGTTKSPQTTTHYKTLNEYIPFFSTFDGDIYDSDIVRTCIHSIAVNGAKLKARHIRRVNGQTFNADSSLDYLLQIRPNEFMNAYDFLYKIISQLFTYNNSFIYIHIENGNVVGLYPLNYLYIEPVEYSGEMYFKFTFKNGQTMTVPYSELLHLRRHFNQNDMFGEDNKKPVNSTLNLLQTIYQGITNSIKSSARLRGWLKFTTKLQPDDLKKQRDNFVQNYLDMNNNGGIGALDSSSEFIPANFDSKMADNDQIMYVRDTLYRYFGVNENIIQSNYNEDQWNAFYSSVLEPIAIQLSLEMTSKIFTSRELGFGNEIIYSASRLMYASTTTKVAMARELMPFGLVTINEMREIFELEPVEGGDKRLQTLNVVNANNADQYQLHDKGVNNNANTIDQGNQNSTN